MRQNLRARLDAIPASSAFSDAEEYPLSGQGCLAGSQRHVLDVILEMPGGVVRPSPAAQARGTNPLSDASCRKCSIRGVAPAVPLAIPDLRTDFRPVFANPKEFHRRKLPVEAGMRRPRCRIVRHAGRHVTRRTRDHFCPDGALSAVDAMHAGLAFACRRRERTLGPRAVSLCFDIQSGSWILMSACAQPRRDHSH